MNGLELFRSTWAALGAGAVLSGLYFRAAVVHTVVDEDRARWLAVAGGVFAIYRVVLAVAFLLFLALLLQFAVLRRQGAALSLLLAAPIAMATAVASALYCRDGGEPATVGAVPTYWARKPVSTPVSFSPCLAASLAFVGFRGRGAFVTCQRTTRSSGDGRCARPPLRA